MGETVVSEVVAERPFGQLLIRIDHADDAKVGLGNDRQSARQGNQCDATAAEGSGKPELWKALGQWHHGGQSQCGRAADEHVHSKWQASSKRGRMMNPDPAMDLVMETHLTIRLVLAPGQLDSVHAQVGVSIARPIGVLGVNDRQCNEGPAVFSPALELRETVDRCLIGENRTAAHFSRPQIPQDARHVAVTEKVLPER